MKILGIDLGLNLGWSALVDGAYAGGGTRTVKEKSKEHKGARWGRVAAGIGELLDAERPDFVAYEDVSRHAGVLAAHSFGFIKYSLLAACAQRAIPARPLGVSEWKFAIGLKGNAEKPTVAAAMAALHGVQAFDSEDHSDSLGIAHASSVLNLFAEVKDADRDERRGRGGKKHRAGAGEKRRGRAGAAVDHPEGVGQAGAD